MLVEIPKLKYVLWFHEYDDLDVKVQELRDVDWGIKKELVEEKVEEVKEKEEEKKEEEKEEEEEEEVKVKIEDVDMDR